MQAPSPCGPPPNPVPQRARGRPRHHRLGYQAALVRRRHRAVRPQLPRLHPVGRRRPGTAIMTIVIVALGPVRRPPVPMTDVYAATGTFPEAAQLARDLAAAVMAVEGVPNIAMFRKNTAAFVHDLPATALANVDGDSAYVRVQVLANAGALDRGKQIAVVRTLTELVAAAAGDPSLTERTWVLLTEAPEGGWGLWRHARTSEELVAAARAESAKRTPEATKEGE